MFQETIAFYRRNPVVLVVALLVGAALTFLVLIDGDGIGIGEVLAIAGFGVILGLLISLVRERKRL